MLPGCLTFGLTIPIPPRIEVMVGGWLFRAVRRPDVCRNLALELLAERRVFGLVQFGHKIDPRTVLDPADRPDKFFVIDDLGILLVFHHQGDGTPLTASTSEDDDFVDVCRNRHMIFADRFDGKVARCSPRVIFLWIVENRAGNDVGSAQAERPGTDHLLKPSPGMLIKLSDLRNDVREEIGLVLERLFSGLVSGRRLVTAIVSGKSVVLQFCP